MTKPHLFTICSFNYLAQVAVLKMSLDLIHPDLPFTLFLCDEITGELPKPLADAHIVPISDIGLPQYEDMALRYSILELNTAVKPFVFGYLFDQLAADFAIYLDPDMLVVAPMDECLELADQGANIVLTPHTTLPIEDGMHPNDFDMARAGIYNLGFCGIAGSDEGRRFTSWWCRKLLTDCRVDLEQGIFVDQKWCDGVPALFSKVAILRHQGYNVGYWNLMHRPLWLRDDGVLMAGPDVARLLHFSGVDMLDTHYISKHQKRLTIDNVNQTTREIFAAYRYQLLGNGFFRLARQPQQLPGERLFKEHDNNLAYARVLKRLLTQSGLPPRLPSHADLASYALAELMPAAAYRLPDFFLVARAMRDDVAQTFSDLVSLDGAGSLLGWFASSGLREMPADPSCPVADHLAWHRQAIAVLGGRRSKDPAITLLQSVTGAEAADQATIFAALANLRGDYLAGLSDAERHAPAPIPAIVRAAHDARGDLRETFDIETASGRGQLLHWAALHFEKEYGAHHQLGALLDEIVRAPERWTEAFADAGAGPAAASPRALDASSWSAIIRHGYQPASDYAIFDQRGPGDRCASSGAAAELITLPDLADRVTLIGYPRAEMGMGEHVRNTAAALARTTVPFEVFDFDSGPRCGMGNTDLVARLAARPSGKINIFHINADQTLLAQRVLGRSLFRNRYNIGYWAWELERFPDAWQDAIALVDEIWAPSKFVHGALRQVTDKPVIHMPLRVELPAPAAAFDAEACGVSDAFSFLFFFDFNSFHGRKNPAGVIHAFQAAFPRGGARPVQLIIKTIGASSHPAAADKLAKLIDGDPRIVRIDDTLPAAEMYALIRHADCFVSLHRSEGFGRGMAEAMAAGRTVIGTGYSGNMDFMTPDNAYLVDYQLIPVGADNYVHGDGLRWAEPNLAHAAETMRHVFDHPAEAAQRAAAGQRLILSQHSAAAVAANIVRRLEQIQRQHGALAGLSGSRITARAVGAR